MKYRSSIIKGLGQGKKIGYPTFNLEVPTGFNYQFGVYATRVTINNRSYRGALHFGPRPTINLAEPSLEIFVLEYTDSVKTREIEFEIFLLLRKIRAFQNTMELKKQIKKDVLRVKEIII